MMKELENKRKVRNPKCRVSQIKMKTETTDNNCILARLSARELESFELTCDELRSSSERAREVLKNDVAYDNFCYDNNYVTKRGCKRFTAEILYRFFTGDNDFVESHTGLEDVAIEKVIFAECMARGAESGKLW